MIVPKVNDCLFPLVAVVVTLVSAGIGAVSESAVRLNVHASPSLNSRPLNTLVTPSVVSPSAYLFVKVKPFSSSVF